MSLTLDHNAGSLCCMGGNHYAKGRTVECVLSPVTALPKGSYLSWNFCEEHLWVGNLPPGRYVVTLHVMESESNETS